jgi:hypothetical protein
VKPAAEQKQNATIHASDNRQRNQKTSEQVSSVTTEAVKLSAQKGDSLAGLRRAHEVDGVGIIGSHRTPLKLIE